MLPINGVGPFVARIGAASVMIVTEPPPIAAVYWSRAGTSACPSGEGRLRIVKGAWLWAIAGALAGLMMTACMFVLRILTGAPTLPELFQDQVLALLPGTLFSFVLDRLQFAPKPLLLVGLAFPPVPVCAGLGWLFGHI